MVQTLRSADFATPRMHVLCDFGEEVYYVTLPSM